MNGSVGEEKTKVNQGSSFFRVVFAFAGEAQAPEPRPEAADLARDGLRYRSVGCQLCSQPIASPGTSLAELRKELQRHTSGEREGRAQDKEDEYAMEKLRSLGYM